jgi:ABC-2 type transport system ATP-binding protein
VTAVIETRRLTKHYKETRAVEQIDLRVERGEIYAFLGRNGAGKSTTIRMLLGMIRPTEGDAALFGEPLRRGGRGPWRRVGHLVETPSVYPELTVEENLDVSRRLYSVPDRNATARIMERLGLAAYAHRRASVLSHGNLQRLALARALLHQPELLILDEPANSLDPAGVVEVRDLLRAQVREQGTTVFMSSHILSEVDRLATRIGIIDRGRLIEELDGAALDQRRAARLVIDGNDRGAQRAVLEKAGFQVNVEADTGRLVLEETRALAAPDTVASLLAMAGVPPTHLATRHEDLEEYFLRLTSADQAVPS